LVSLGLFGGSQGGSIKRRYLYITGICCLFLRPSYATDSDEALASFVVADNGSIAATLVFSLYELWFTNNPFYAAMVTLSVIKVWGN
jgi:hypothetical protein